MNFEQAFSETRVVKTLAVAFEPNPKPHHLRVVDKVDDLMQLSVEFSQLSASVPDTAVGLIVVINNGDPQRSAKFMRHMLTQMAPHVEFVFAVTPPPLVDVAGTPILRRYEHGIPIIEGPDVPYVTDDMLSVLNVVSVVISAPHYLSVLAPWMQQLKMDRHPTLIGVAGFNQNTHVERLDAKIQYLHLVADILTMNSNGLIPYGVNNRCSFGKVDGGKIKTDSAAYAAVLNSPLVPCIDIMNRDQALFEVQTVGKELNNLPLKSINMAYGRSPVDMMTSVSAQLKAGAEEGKSLLEDVVHDVELMKPFIKPGKVPLVERGLISLSNAENKPVEVTDLTNYITFMHFRGHFKRSKLVLDPRGFVTVQPLGEGEDSEYELYCTYDVDFTKVTAIMTELVQCL